MIDAGMGLPDATGTVGSVCPGKKEKVMNERGYTGLEFIEGFSLLAGAIWIIGALLLGGMAMIGADRAGQAVIAANENPAAAAPAAE